MELLKSIKEFRGTPQATVNWDRMLSGLRGEMELRKNRYRLSDTHSSNGIYLIKSLLTLLDNPDYLNKDKDMFKLYKEHIAPEARDLAKKFDPTIVGPMENVFVESRKGNPLECLVPTRENLILGSVTIDSDWDDWEEVQPIQIMSHNSMELNYDFEGSYIKFNNDVPDYVMISINMEQLIVKYIKWLREFEYDLSHYHVDIFIKDQVLQPFVESLTRPWVVNLIRNLLDFTSFLDINELVKMIAKSTPFVGRSNLISGFKDIENIIERVETNKIKIGDFFATPVVNRLSLKDIIQMNLKTFELQATTRMIGYQTLRDVNLGIIATSILDRRREGKLESGLLVKFEIELRRIGYSKWNSHLSSKYLSQIILSEVETLSLLV